MAQSSAIATACSNASTAASWVRPARIRPSPAEVAPGEAPSAPVPGCRMIKRQNRVKDMDEEGTDVHFLVPSSWTGVVGLDDTTLEVGLSRAYHRHMADFCGQFPDFWGAWPRIPGGPCALSRLLLVRGLWIATLTCG